MKELYCTLEDADDEESVIAPSSFVHKPPNGLSTPRLPLDSSSDTATDKRYHAGLELAQCKAKLRRLRHELSVFKHVSPFVNVLVVKNSMTGKRADLHQQRSGGEWGVCVLDIVGEVWNWHCSCIFKDHRCNLKQVTAGSIPQPHQLTVPLVINLSRWSSCSLRFDQTGTRDCCQIMNVIYGKVSFE